MKQWTFHMRKDKIMFLTFVQYGKYCGITFFPVNLPSPNAKTCFIGTCAGVYKESAGKAFVCNECPNQINIGGIV